MRTIVLLLLLGLTVLSGHTTWSQTSSSGKRKPRLAQWIITSNVSGTIKVNEKGTEYNLPTDGSFEIWLDKGRHTLVFRAPGGFTIQEKIRVKELDRTEYKLDIKQKATEALVAELNKAFDERYDKIDWNLVKMTVQAGADVNARLKNGGTALMRAVDARRSDVMRLLFEKGADANAQDTLGATALIIADSPAVVKLLLDNGADVNARNMQGAIGLWYASFYGRTEVIKLLLENGIHVNARSDSTHWTALMEAASQGRIEIVKLLMEHGADVNLTARGKTALVFAYPSGGRYFGNSYQEHWEVTKFLLEHGADAKAADKYQIMIVATEAGQLEIVNLLLINGTAVNGGNDLGRSALMAAVSRSQTDIVKLLLEKGADVNDTNSNGSTCLMYASQIEIAKMLLEHGADVNARNFWGRSVMLNVIIYHKPEIIKLLLDNGADVNAKDSTGRTILMAAAVGYPEAVKLLIERGTDLNTRSKDGTTALFHATWARRHDIVQLLLENGADVNAKDKRGKTALHYARTKKIKQLLRSYVAKK